MFRQILQNPLAPLLGLIVMMGGPATGQDAGGAGSSGTIGRGTTVEERSYSILTPSLPATTVATYTPPVAEARPSTPPAEVAPAPAIIPRPAPPSELAVSLPALVRRNPYVGYHRSWVHGYWNVRISGSPLRLTSGPAGSDLASWKGPLPGLGRGLGWGLPGWSIGPMVYDWGYITYANPFRRGASSSGPARGRFDDYSRPINVESAPPTLSLLNEALVNFRSAREAFRREDYPRALELTDASLRLMPDDPMIQQFRALTCFAQSRYDDAAAILHAVLPVAPGWDWKTMVSLYGDRDIYTRQLRLLEAYTDANPRSAAAHFVLAYHYLATGYPDEAVARWERVLSLRPGDMLSAGLIRELQPGRAASANARTSTAADSSAGEAGVLEGTWTAHRGADVTITLEFQPRGQIIWKLRQPGGDREYSGFTINERDVLTLYEDQDNALVGTMTWQDEDHFTFRILTSPAGDQGLSFARSR